MKFVRAIDVMGTDARHERLPHDPAYEEGSGWQNGRVVPVDETAISIRDEGFLRSTAIYDAVSTSRGMFFRLDDHLDRFFASCKRVYLRSPLDREEIREMLHRMVAVTGLQDTVVYWIVTRGELQYAFDDNHRVFKSASIPRVGNLYGMTEPYAPQHDDDRQQRGVNVIVSERVIRIPPESVDPKAKNLHWLDLTTSLGEAVMRGAEWSVLSDGNGCLTEAPGANVFVVNKGVAATPGEGCLEGITRLATFELCEEFGVPVEVRKVGVDELESADEAFFTTTAGGIMPIGTVNGTQLGGSEGPGDLSVRLHNAYWEKRWDGWHGEPVDYSLANR